MMVKQRIAREARFRALQRDAALASIDLFAVVADAVGKGTKAATAFQIAGIVATATVQAAYQVAEGFAAAASQQYWKAAQHWLAAAKYAAVGAVQVAGVAGGGGGSAASFGAGAQSRGTTPTRQDDKQEREKVIIYVSGHLINTKPDYDRVFADGVQSFQEAQNPGQEYGSF